MENKAEFLIDEAIKRAEQIASETEQEIEKLLVQVKLSGQKSGFEKGQDWTLRLHAMQENINREIREDLLKCALHVAEHIVKLELKAVPGSISHIAARVLTMISEASEVSLRAHPEDVDYLRADKKQLLEELERAKDVEIRSDKQVLRGGLLVQTEHGLIDAQMATQLEEIARAMGVTSGAYH